MANWNKRVAENVHGTFFVDSSCIDCATCRQIAPKIFAEAADHSYVRAQPGVNDTASLSDAARALVSCPTNSIGGQGPVAHASIKRAISDFPQEIAAGVRYCGFTSESSFGASSYFLIHKDGNWLIDSPRWVPQLAKRIAELGGITGIFLTHRDDVADAPRYAQYFGARLIIHEADQDALSAPHQTICGDDPIRLAEGLLAVPVPGHTAGSMVLVAQDRYLFSGDHLWWSVKTGHLGASRSACWFSWRKQQRSMARLLDHSFTWVLPGHGDRISLPVDRMRAEITGLIDRMAAMADDEDG